MANYGSIIILVIALIIVVLALIIYIFSNTNSGVTGGVGATGEIGNTGLNTGFTGQEGHKGLIGTMGLTGDIGITGADGYFYNVFTSFATDNSSDTPSIINTFMDSYYNLLYPGDPITSTSVVLNNTENTSLIIFDTSNLDISNNIYLCTVCEPTTNVSNDNTCRRSTGECPNSNTTPKYTDSAGRPLSIRIESGKNYNFVISPNNVVYTSIANTENI